MLFLAGALLVTAGVAAAAHAIMYKRDAKSSSLWVIICLLLPGVGPWLYWVLGINRVQRRAVRIFGRRARLPNLADADRASPAADPIQEAVAHLAPLRAAADRVTRLPLLPGNALSPLHSGEETYPAMLAAIRSAQRSVTLASYIFDWDATGRGFCNALGEAASRGVDVRILLDGIGALGSWSRVGRRLLRAGAKVAPFFPLRFPLGRLRINLRNHRKILVVDGRVGFTGGINISDRYLVRTSDPHRCEDLHFRVDGPVVAELQHVFVEDWLLATDESLSGESWFPPLAPVGPAVCRGIASGPDEDFEKVEIILLAAVSAARQSVRLVTPYFVPPPTLTRAMVLAALRGVRVSLFLPSHLDLPFMRWVADAYLWQILQHGVRVYHRPPPFVHTKLAVVDDRWLLIGSANLDPRSFRLNFEFNVEAYDAALARGLGSWLDGLAAESHEVTLHEVDARSTPRRLRDGFVRLFSPYL